MGRELERLQLVSVRRPPEYDDESLKRFPQEHLRSWAISVRAA